MICFACKGFLKNSNFESQNADICFNCGGMRLEKCELGKITNSLLPGDKVEALTVKETFRKDIVNCYKQDNSILRKCPKCKVDISVFNYAFDSNIILDKCQRCEGIWTDRNEIIQSARHIKGNPITRAYSETLAENCKL